MSFNRVFDKLGITSASLKDKKKPLAEEEFEEAKTLHRDTAQQELIKQQLENLPKKRVADYESAQVEQYQAAQNAITNLQAELNAIYNETDGKHVTKHFLFYVENANGYAKVIEDYLKIVDAYLKTGSKESQNDTHLRTRYKAYKSELASYNTTYAKFQKPEANHKTASADKTSAPSSNRMR